MISKEYLKGYYYAAHNNDIDKFKGDFWYGYLDNALSLNIDIHEKNTKYVTSTLRIKLSEKSILNFLEKHPKIYSFKQETWNKKGSLYLRINKKEHIIDILIMCNDIFFDEEKNNKMKKVLDVLTHSKNLEKVKDLQKLNI